MTIEDALRAYLVLQSGVTDTLTSTNSIRTDKEPQPDDGTIRRKYIIIKTDPGTEIEHYAGGQSNLAETTLQLFCHADTRTNARNIAEQVRLVFKAGLRGAMSTETVHGVFVESIMDKPSDTIGGDETGLPVVILTMRILHSITVT